jgi:D-aminopeptidase
MQGIDGSFDAMFILSMHAKAHTRAVFAHTWSLNIYDYRVNGKSIGELGMAVYYAACQECQPSSYLETLPPVRRPGASW